MAGEKFFTRVRTLAGDTFDSEVADSGDGETPSLDELIDDMKEVFREAKHGVVDVTSTDGVVTIIPFHAVASIQFFRCGEEATSWSTASGS